MDLSFFRRAEQRFASRSAAGLDYRLFLAMLRAHQAETAAAQAGMASAAGASLPGALIEILLGAPAWRDAARARRGSFNPAYAQLGKAA